MAVASAARAFALSAALLGTAAVAQERFDHRGALGLLVGGGVEFKDSIVRTRESHDFGLRYDLDLGGTWAIGHDGNELMLLGRATLGGPQLDLMIGGGYRGYFGVDRFKTFFDLGAVVHVHPVLVAGPRVGFGVQYELTSVVGWYAGAAAQVAAGNGLRFAGEVTTGLQLRTYVLE